MAESAVWLDVDSVLPIAEIAGALVTLASGDPFPRHDYGFLQRRRRKTGRATNLRRAFSEP